MCNEFVFVAKGIHVEPVDAERTMWSILREMEAPRMIQTFPFPYNYITLCDFYQGLIAILFGMSSYMDSHAINTFSYFFA